jgi:PAS domain S-box-containing protein
LRALIEDSGDGIIVCDKDGVIRIVNPAAQRQHGVVPDRKLSSTWAAGFALLTAEGKTLPVEETPLHRAMRGERISSERFKVKRPDGTIRTLTVTASPIRGEDASNVGAVLITRDETERIELEEQRIALLRRTEDAVRARDDLLAMVSHDLKNPLNSITLASSVLRAKGAAGDPSGKLVENISRAAVRMNVLINDLLDAAGIEAGSFPVSPEPIEVEALVTEGVDSVLSIATDRGVIIEKRPLPSGIRVLCDRPRILQVLGNLIGNAIKFSSEGESVVVDAKVDGSSVQFTVQDSGDGIAAEHLPLIFDRYWQGKRSGRAGAGLGLFIAKGIVEAHGGRIDVQSTPGDGSTLRFTLPIAP